MKWIMYAVAGMFAFDYFHSDNPLAIVFGLVFLISAVSLEKDKNAL